MDGKDRMPRAKKRRNRSKVKGIPPKACAAAQILMMYKMGLVITGAVEVAFREILGPDVTCGANIRHFT